MLCHSMQPSMASARIPSRLRFQLFGKFEIALMRRDDLGEGHEVRPAADRFVHGMDDRLIVACDQNLPVACTWTKSSRFFPAVMGSAGIKDLIRFSAHARPASPLPAA